MQNISFQAKLIVNQNLYKNIPEGTPDRYIDDLIKGYKDFLDIELIKKVTEGDTIELYREKNRGNFAIGVKYITDALEEPLVSGIYTNKKNPDIKKEYLIFDTMVFLGIKSGVKQCYFEMNKNYFIRALKTLLKKYED